MKRELIHDPILLARKARPATEADRQIAADLCDTLDAHLEECVGMAANMIGEPVAIIAFVDMDDDKLDVMYNPEILKAEGPYEAQEACLSLLGGPRKATRYQKIKLRWQNEKFQTRIKTYTGWTAQIIQHEVDHCKGVLI